MCQLAMARFPVRDLEAAFFGHVIKNLAVTAAAIEVHYGKNIADFFRIHAEFTENFDGISVGMRTLNTRSA